MTDKDYAEILKGLAVPIHAEPAMDRAIELLEQESKTGHWIDRWDKILLCENKDCSICGYMAQTRHNYCPNCGAKMVEPQERSEE